MNPGSAIYIRNHLDELQEIPEPGEPWRYRDLEIGRSVFHQLQSRGLIEKVGSSYVGDGTVSVWETKRETYEKIENYLEKQDNDD